MIDIWECLEIKWLNLINLVSVWLESLWNIWHKNFIIVKKEYLDLVFNIRNYGHEWEYWNEKLKFIRKKK